jgi:hypothetical protein
MHPGMFSPDVHFLLPVPTRKPPPSTAGAQVAFDRLVDPYVSHSGIQASGGVLEM